MFSVPLPEVQDNPPIRMQAVAKLKRAASLPRMKNRQRPPVYLEAVSDGEKRSSDDSTDGPPEAAADVATGTHTEPGAETGEAEMPVSPAQVARPSRSRGSKEFKGQVRAMQSLTLISSTNSDSSPDEAPRPPPLNFVVLPNFASPTPSYVHEEMRRLRLLRSPTPISLEYTFINSCGILQGPSPFPSLEVLQKGLFRSRPILLSWSRGSKEFEGKVKTMQFTFTSYTNIDSSPDEAPPPPPLNFVVLLNLASPIPSHVLELQILRLLRSPTPTSPEHTIFNSCGIPQGLSLLPSLEALQRGLFCSPSKRRPRSRSRGLIMLSVPLPEVQDNPPIRMQAVTKLKRAASLPRMKDGRRPPMHSEAVSNDEKRSSDDSADGPPEAAADVLTEAHMEPEAETGEAGRLVSPAQVARSKCRSRSRGSKEFKGKVRAMQTPILTSSTNSDSSPDEAPSPPPLNFVVLPNLASPIPSHVLELQILRSLRSPTPTSLEHTVFNPCGIPQGPSPLSSLEALQRGLFRSNSTRGSNTTRMIAMHKLTGGMETYDLSLWWYQVLTRSQERSVSRCGTTCSIDSVKGLQRNSRKTYRVETTILHPHLC